MFSLLATATEPNAFERWLETYKPIWPIPVLVIVLAAVWRMFRGTWRDLDQESHVERQKLLDAGKTDLRPFVALVMCAVILTMQEYYGDRRFYTPHVLPILEELDTGSFTMSFFRRAHVFHVPFAVKLAKYEELYTFVWWSGTRIFGYVLVPFSLWKLIFRSDSLLDMGLRAKGFFKHFWIYGLFLGVVLPAMYVVSKQADFGAYYPFYKHASRSWFDFLIWEAMYFAQFFALEMFFRGFWVATLKRSFGSGAIFAMAVPYCMIHYSKPYLEVVGAIIAGIALGSLSIRTKSIYQGFLVHVTVAGLMDWLALSHRGQLPLVFWPPG